jgi:hypothetical protein
MIHEPSAVADPYAGLQNIVLWSYGLSTAQKTFPPVGPPGPGVQQALGPYGTAHQAGLAGQRYMGPLLPENAQLNPGRDHCEGLQDPV